MIQNQIESHQSDESNQFKPGFKTESIQIHSIGEYGQVYHSLIDSKPGLIYLEAQSGGHNQVGQSETTLRSIAQLVCSFSS